MAERVQLKRTKGWRKPPNTVSVARPATWGNPFHTDRPTVWGVDPDGGRYRVDRVLTAEEAVQMYVNFHTFGDWRRLFTERVRDELAGKNLACWCPLDAPCHADVLLRVAAGGAP
jgi:hypothetical protein